MIMTAMESMSIRFRHDPDLRLHHVGIVVPAIEEHCAFYVDTLGYRQRTPIIHDPVQTAFVQFFAIPGSDHYLELVAPDSESSKLQRAARKGLPLNHLCYSCENMTGVLLSLRESGCLIIQDPVSAVAFDGRPIAWAMIPDGVLIEIVERGPEGSL
jgi:methylmalonyl-CoA/ethylmalonyl-CoA epimerase